MAVYAAQVHRMDWNIGRVVEHLRDNDGCAEPYDDLGGGGFTAINDPGAGAPLPHRHPAHRPRSHWRRRARPPRSTHRRLATLGGMPPGTAKEETNASSRGAAER